MITREIIERIRSSMEPLSIASVYISLKPQGKRFVGLCPFHKEKTPSFYMNEDGMYHCFGCGKGGDFIKFIMEMEKLNFTDALHFLAEKLGIKIEHDISTEAFKQRELLLDIHKETCSLYHKLLFTQQGNEALKYLENRGIDKEIITQFSLGYAPDEWEYLVNHFAPKIDLALLSKSSLIIPKEKSERHYDRFRNRVMIPIVDLQENVVGFGGRALKPDEVKYINSSESPIFQKGNLLFALCIARKSIPTRGYAILVEGYFDVISLHVQGFNNAVASLGTSLTEQQIHLLKRYTDTVYICYDADTAGKKATDRAIQMLLENDVNLKIIVLDEGEDPDSFCRKKGKEAFQTKIDQAEDFMQFILENKIKAHGKLTPRTKSKIFSELMPVLLPLLNAVKRELLRSGYIKMISEMLKVQEETIQKSLKEYAFNPKASYTDAPINFKIPLSEKILLRGSLKYPEILETILSQEDETFFEGLFTSSIFEKLVAMIRNGEAINEQSLILALGDDEKIIFSSIALEDLKIDEMNAIEKSRQDLKKQHIERKLGARQEKIKKADQTSSIDEINEILRQKMNLAKNKQKLF